MAITVQRQPTNMHDSLALAVYLPSEENEEKKRNLDAAPEQQRLGYVAGWLAEVLSPLIDDGKISIEGRIASEFQDWSAALSRRRLPLEIHALGQAAESQQELSTRIGLLQKPGGPAYRSQ